MTNSVLCEHVKIYKISLTMWVGYRNNDTKELIQFTLYLLHIWLSIFHILQLLN